jgi:hypothetical protein
MMPDKTYTRGELVQSGNLYLKLWVLLWAVVIVLGYFLFVWNSTWVNEHISWVATGCLIVFILGFFIDEFYHLNAADLHNWENTDNEAVYRSGISPLILLTFLIFFCLLLLEWGVFQWAVPQYSQYNFFDANPGKAFLLTQSIPVVAFVTLLIVYYIFRLKE